LEKGRKRETIGFQAGENLRVAVEMKGGDASLGISDLLGLLRYFLTYDRLAKNERSSG
jgi:hypothetical protein